MQESIHFRHGLMEKAKDHVYHVSQLSIQPIGKPVNLSISLIIMNSYPIIQLANQSISQSVNQSISQSVNQSISQSVIMKSHSI